MPTPQPQAARRLAKTSATANEPWRLGRSDPVQIWRLPHTLDLGNSIRKSDSGLHLVIVGVGMTLVIGSGGIDLLVGSLMAIAGALAPLIFLGKFVPLPTWVGVRLAFFLPVLVAGMFGWFNGWLITSFQNPTNRCHPRPIYRRPWPCPVLTNGNLQAFSRTKLSR